MGLKVLIVDDDVTIQDLVNHVLSAAGFQTALASTGSEALDQVRRYSPDIVVLDYMLPDIDGFAVCREIRRSSTVPILFLSGRNYEAERVAALELGADDYMVKPFGPSELIARIRAILRRAESSPKKAPEREIRCGEAVIDLGGKEVRIDGEVIALTPREYAILEALIMNPRQALSREQLVRLAWGDPDAAEARLVDLHVSHLRNKVKQALVLYEAIKTVRGIGYKYIPPS